MNYRKYPVNKAKLFILCSILMSFLFFGCTKKFPEDKNISGVIYTLLNQDSTKVNFPSDFKGHILVITFIYTNCPDICPMTTHNMQEVQKKLADEGINDVQFAAMSFDPNRDTPKVLKEYAEVRDMKLNNFVFLTGNKKDVDSILHEFDFIAIPGDTTFVDKTHPVYFFTHTDKLFLVDKKGRIRTSYRGSKVNSQKLISDIKSLEN